MEHLLQTTIVECRRCSGLLDDNGLCTDETCPFSDRQQTGGRYCVIRVDFPEGTGDYSASKLADQLLESAGGYGIASLVEEGVASA